MSVKNLVVIDILEEKLMIQTSEKLKLATRQLAVFVMTTNFHHCILLIRVFIVSFHVAVLFDELMLCTVPFSGANNPDAVIAQLPMKCFVRSLFD